MYRHPGVMIALGRVVCRRLLCKLSVAAKDETHLQLKHYERTNSRTFGLTCDLFSRRADYLLFDNSGFSLELEPLSRRRDPWDSVSRDDASERRPERRKKTIR